MCKKISHCNNEIDDCLKKTIERINKYTQYRTLCCCCGHGKYKVTIIIRDKNNKVFELFSKISLPLKKKNRYYRMDLDGYYYIPELVIIKSI